MNSKSKYDLWNSIGSPKYALAPMVDINDLPFRILCRKYGTQLTFTQMYNVKLFASIPEHRNVARFGHYGSFLLDHPEEVYKLVGYLCNNNLKCGISCKIRLFPDLSKTFELVQKLEDLGISVLTVHGRTKNWDAIKEIKKLVKIPVIANGGLENFDDIDRCLEYTGCDCVMSGEKMIEMPTFFSKKMYDINDIALEYCNTWKEYVPLDKIKKNELSKIRGHMFKFLYTGCNMYPEYNQKIGNTRSLDEIINIVLEMKDKMKDMKMEDKYGWYMRHRKNEKNKSENNEKINKNENQINYDDIDIDSLF